MQRTLFDLLFERLELLFDFVELLLPSHIIYYFVVLVIMSLDLRLYLFTLVVKVLDILYQSSQLSCQLLFLLCNLA